MEPALGLLTAVLTAMS